LDESNGPEDQNLVLSESLALKDKEYSLEVHGHRLEWFVLLFRDQFATMNVKA
jgi:hypothetical protein